MSKDKPQELESVVERKVISIEMWRFKKNILMAGIIFVGLIVVFFAIGDLSADIIIGFAIEWIRVSTAGTLVIGLGIIISVLVIDKKLDRVFDNYLAVWTKKSE